MKIKAVLHLYLKKTCFTQKLSHSCITFLNKVQIQNMNDQMQTLWMTQSWSIYYLAKKSRAAKCLMVMPLRWLYLRLSSMLGNTQDLVLYLVYITKTIWKGRHGRKKGTASNIRSDTNDPPPVKYRLGTVSKNILLEGLNLFHSANFILSSDVDHSQIVWETANAIHQTLSRNSCTCQEDR